MPADRDRVVIKIDVDADTSGIERVRKKLEELCREADDCSKTMDRFNDKMRQTSEIERKTKVDNDRLGNSMRSLGRHTSQAASRWDGFRKSVVGVLQLRKDIGNYIKGIGGLITKIAKFPPYEIAGAFAAIAASNLIFRQGAGFINLYRGALNSLTYAFSAAAVAAATFVAAQQQFKAVSSGALYSKGAANTGSRFEASSGAMQMLTSDKQLQVFGGKSLEAAFGTISKQKQVEGADVAALRGLGNVAGGIGGDIGKNFEKAAEFYAELAKNKGLGGNTSALAKELGPDFSKILSEAQGLGINTFEEFQTALANGELGPTFRDKYKGQLEALNNTLVGQFKSAFSDLKLALQDMGGGFLQPASDALTRLQSIFERTLIQLAPVLGQFGEGFFMDVVDLIDKAATRITKMVIAYQGGTGAFFDVLKSGWTKVADAFEVVQDYFKKFEAAGEIIVDMFSPVIKAIGTALNGTMNDVNRLVVQNKPALMSFSDALVGMIEAISNFSTMTKNALFAILPFLTEAVKFFGMLFSGFAKFGNMMMKISKPLGALVALYATKNVAGRFFSQTGDRFGKDMSVKANNVYVNGSPVGGAAGAAGSYRGGVPLGGQAAANLGVGSRMRNAMAGSWRGDMARGTGFFGSVGNAGGAARTAFGRAGGVSGMGLGMPGMMGATFLGGAMSSSDNQLVSGAGSTLMGAGLVGSMSQGVKIPVGGKVGSLGAGHLAGIAATGIGAYKASDFITGGGFVQNTLGLGNTSGIAAKVASGGIGMAAGAGTGAAIGAAIGSILPGVGTAIGAGAGAVIGGVVGGIKGWMNAGKNKRLATEAAESLVGGYSSSVDTAIKTGNLDELKDLSTGLQASINEARNTLVNQDQFNKKMKELQPQLDAANKKIDIYTGNTKIATEYMGVSADSLNDLATAAGIDLTSKLMTFREILNLVADDAERKSIILKNIIAESQGLVAGGVTDVFAKRREMTATMQAVDSMQNKRLTDKSYDTGVDTIEAIFKKTVLETGGSAQAFAAMPNVLADLIKEGGAFAGDTDLIKIFNDLFGGESLVKMLKGPDGKGLDVYGSAFGVPTSAIETTLRNDPKQVEAMLRAFDSGAFGTWKPTTMGPPAPAVAGTINRTLTVTINGTMVSTQTIDQIRTAILEAERDWDER